MIMQNSNNRMENIMDCVKKAFFEGCQRGHQFHKMRHAIIVELRRVGFDSSEIKDKILEWNQRCEKPVSLSEQKIQLLAYVDWVFEHEGKTGCRALEDYCLGKDNCQWYLRKYMTNRADAKLPFNINEVHKFLEERYKAEAYILNLIIDVIHKYQYEKATGKIIYIGYRKICSLIRDAYNHTLMPMEIHRKINILILEGIIQKVEQGKSGNFRNKANGYMFLSWEYTK